MTQVDFLNSSANNNAPEPKGPSRREVWKMFDRISPKYDRLNRLLSFRRDIAWRRKLAALLNEQPRQTVLDLATGTADVLLSLFENSSRIAEGVGIDMAEKMLRLGQRKVAHHRGKLADSISLVRANAEMLPIASDRFDAVTIAFGIRNLSNVSNCLDEMLRVLKSGGRALILEFSIPSNWFVRLAYLFYFRQILPRVGGLISGDAHAYHYLNQTVEAFPYGEQFTRLMEARGFENVRAVPLTFGVASIYIGECP